MTDKEKEKEAIRVLNEDLKLAKEEDSIDIDVLTGNLEIALNLIEKQQAEISKLKNKNKELLRKLRNRVKEVKKLTRYSLYKKEFSTLNKQLQQKDKIINLMGEKIFVEGIIWENKEDVKQYFERKVEE